MPRDGQLLLTGGGVPDGERLAAAARRDDARAVWAEGWGPQRFRPALERGQLVAAHGVPDSPRPVRAGGEDAAALAIEGHGIDGARMPGQAKLLATRGDGPHAHLLVEATGGQASAVGTEGHAPATALARPQLGAGRQVPDLDHAVVVGGGATGAVPADVKRADPGSVARQRLQLLAT